MAPVGLSAEPPLYTPTNVGSCARTRAVQPCEKEATHLGPALLCRTDTGRNRFPSDWPGSRGSRARTGHIGIWVMLSSTDRCSKHYLGRRGGAKSSYLAAPVGPAPWTCRVNKNGLNRNGLLGFKAGTRRKNFGRRSR